MRMRPLVMSAHAQRALGLVKDTAARGAVHIAVVGAAGLVHGGLRVVLGRVGLHFAGDFVRCVGDGFFDLGAG